MKTPAYLEELELVKAIMTDPMIESTQLRRRNGARRPTLSEIIAEIRAKATATTYGGALCHW